jgi:hypothetical protein
MSNPTINLLSADELIIFLYPCTLAGSVFQATANPCS